MAAQMIVIVMSISFVVFVSLLHIIGKVRKWPSCGASCRSDVPLCDVGLNKQRLC